MVVVVMKEREREREQEQEPEFRVIFFLLLFGGLVHMPNNDTLKALV